MALTLKMSEICGPDLNQETDMRPFAFTVVAQMFNHGKQSFKETFQKQSHDAKGASGVIFREDEAASLRESSNLILPSGI